MINLSVIPAPRNLSAILAVVFYALTLGCLVALWMQSLTHAALREEAARFAEQNQKISAALVTERQAAADAPEIAELRALAARVEWYNDQIGAGAPPILEMLDLLEETLPRDVRASAIFYDRRGRFITFSLVSEVEESLLKSIEALQDGFGAAAVELERQVTLEGSGERVFQYDLRVSS